MTPIKTARLRSGIQRELDRHRILLALPRHGIGAEIGVWKGAFARKLLRFARPQMLHLIDPWTRIDDEAHKRAMFNRLSDEEIEQIYVSVVRRFGSRKNVTIHRATSIAASSHLPGLDWAYIDGDHTYEAVLGDLRAYWALLRPGGVLAGDDYGLKSWWDDGITKAVAEFAREQGCEPTIIGAQFLMRKA